MKSKFLILCIFSLILVLGCSKTKTIEVKEPHLVGEIIELDTKYSRFLLDGTGSINSYKRGEVWLTVPSNSQMVNQNNQSLIFESLKLGMKVEVELIDGALADSEPQKGTVEHLLIVKP